MKRSPNGSLIGAVLLLAVCAGPSSAERHPPPEKVHVKPRMASSAKPSTGTEKAREQTAEKEDSPASDAASDPVWHALVVDRVSSRNDATSAGQPPAPRCPEPDSEGQLAAPAIAQPWHDDAAAPPARVDDRQPASQVRVAQTCSVRDAVNHKSLQRNTRYDDPRDTLAAWQTTDNDLGLPNTDPVEDVPSIMPPGNVRPLESNLDVPLVATPLTSGRVAPVMAWDTDIADLRDRIADLEQDRQLRGLTERVREVEDAVDVTDQRWEHTWGGRMQADIVYWPDDADLGGQPNYLEFRRLRFFCAGEGYGVWRYKLEFDLAPEIQRQAEVVGGLVDLDDFGLELKDAWLGISDLPVLGFVRAGHFKVPFGLEELTSSKYLTFMERGLPRVFVPGREFGIAAYRHVPHANITWAYGAFYEGLSQTAHNLENDNQGLRAGLRATWAPWYDECTEGRNLLHTGMSYLYTHDADREIRFRSRPEIHRGNFVIDTGRLAATDLQQVGTEIAWVDGPLSIQSEFIWTHAKDATLGHVDLWGTYAYASYFLTGEHRPYDREEGVFRRVSPYENFWLVRTARGCASGKGAWEMAVRWSYLQFKHIDGQKLHDVTAGLNWYWNPHARLMLNWIHPIYRDNTSGTAQGDLVGLRFQVDF